MFGRKLVSVPFAPYGGVCADDAGVGRALVEEGERAQTVFEIEYPSHGGSEGADADKTPPTSHGSHQSHFYPPAMIRTYANSERRMKIMRWICSGSSRRYLVLSDRTEECRGEDSWVQAMTFYPTEK